MSRPLVSVVMSVYNGQDYLPQAVEGILNQTLADFEFIVIDDGSTDRTWETLNAYAARDGRLVLLRNPENIGYTRSLNKGLALARGRYIARQDADDRSLPERLARQVAFLEAHPEVGLVGTGIEAIDADGLPQAGLDFFTTETEDDALQRQLLHDCVLCHGSLVLRRQCLETVGAYDASLEPAEDYDMWLRLAEVTRLACVPPALYQYRWHPQSVSRARFSQQIYHKAVALDRALTRRFGGGAPAPQRQRAAEFYVRAAFAKFQHGDEVTARSSLARAQRLYPPIFEAASLLESLAESCTATGKIEADLRLAETLLAALPPSRAVRRLRPRLLSRLHMREVFAAAPAGDRARVAAHLGPGLRHNPAWLLNRGVLSLLAQTLLRRGPRASHIRRVYLTLYIWSDAGGIEEIVTALACALQRAGVDAAVFAWARVAAGPSQYEARLKAHNIPLYYPGGFWGRLAADWQYRVAAVNKALALAGPPLLPLAALQVVRRRASWQEAQESVRGRLRRWALQWSKGYDVDFYMRWRLSIAHALRPASLLNQHGLGTAAAMQWAMQRGLPVIYSEGNAPGADHHLRQWRPLQDCLRRVHGLTALSEGARAGLVEHLSLKPERITIIAGPVEFPERQDDHPAAQAAENRRPRILYVGRLDPMKGLAVLVEAAGLLAARAEPVEVLLAGDGAEREALQALARDKSVEGVVTFAGRVNRAQLPGLYESADIFVIPSLHFEGLGLVVLEAMSFGLPIVASDIPAFRDPVAHRQNGLLFPPGDACALAQALEFLLAQPAERKRMGQNSRERFAAGGYDPGRVAARYLKVYQGALAAAGALSQATSQGAA